MPALLEAINLKPDYGPRPGLHGLSFGLAPLLVEEIFRIMRLINQQERVSILLVEQNASLALDLAEDAYLIETGRLVLAGKSADIAKAESVRASYLGY